MIIKPSERIGDVKEYYFATKLAEIGGMNARGANVLNLGIGSPDLLPPKEVIDELKNATDLPRANMYQSYRGLLELRQAFANHYMQMMDVSIEGSSEVLPLIGSKEGIMHIAMSFLNPGDEVLVPNPGYPAYRVTAELAGAKSIFYELSEEGNWLPDIVQLSKLDLSNVKLMWINYPNMPTGANISLGDLKQLVDFTRENGILLCHDNPYNFILNPKPKSIFNIEGAKENCIELYSLSKCYNMAGWRVGALIAGSEIISTVMRFKSNMDSGMYLPVQKAAVAALKMGNEWFDELNSIYRKRQQQAFRIFDLLDCTYDVTCGGMFVWAKVPGYIADVEQWIDDILQEAKVFYNSWLHFWK